MPIVKEQIMWNKGLKDYQAYQKLKSLAANPFDLSKPGELTPERLGKFYGEACGFQLLYGTERVTEETMRALADLALEAQVVQKMEELQSGAIVNFIEGYASENRSALHTALRDVFDHPNPSAKAQEAANAVKAELIKLKNFIQKIDQLNFFTDLIYVAIGGSQLGPEAHCSALESLKNEKRRVHFVSNVDPDEAQAVLSRVNIATTLVAIVSKSGTTLETSINEKFIKARYELEGLNPSKHFISITMPGTPMDNAEQYLECFYLWDWVGGRYSTTSMVGGLLISFMCGFHIFEEFLRGAHAMDLCALKQDLRQNLPLLGALLGIWNRDFLGYPTYALIPYSHALRRYTAHIQQLDMESNGKHIDHTGKTVDYPTGCIVWGEPGTNAQHSFFQLIHQGTDIIPLEFIGFKEGQYSEDLMIEGTFSQEKLLANLFAQALALATGKTNDNPNKAFAGNRPSHMLLAKKLTPYTLGALLSYYEHKTAFQGFIWNVNSFDQEGVQLGKELSNRIIQRFATKHGKGPKDDRAYPLGDTYLRILDTIQ